MILRHPGLVWCEMSWHRSTKLCLCVCIFLLSSQPHDQLFQVVYISEIIHRCFTPADGEKATNLSFPTNKRCIKALSSSWDANRINSIDEKHNSLNALRLRKNGRHFTDDTFKRISVNENIQISLKISLKYVPKGPINHIPTLVRFPTHICVTWTQWVKRHYCKEIIIVSFRCMSFILDDDQHISFNSLRPSDAYMRR